MSPSRLLPFLLLFGVFSAGAAFSSSFSEHLLSSYDDIVRNYFPPAVLNSTGALKTFVDRLPALDANVTIKDDCDANDTVKECLDRLPSGPRDRILVVGNYLDGTGTLAGLDYDCLAKVAPVLLSSRQDAPNEEPQGPHSEPEKERAVPLATSIGYGFLFVTIISFCSLGGAIIMPFIETNCYKKCLMWMVGLAVGTLSGSGLLHLMPHSFGMTPEEIGYGYLYRASTIFFGIYLFFITERVLRSVESWRKRRRDTERRKRHQSRASRAGNVGETPENNGRGSPELELPPICSMHVQCIQTNEEMSDMKIPHMKPRTPRHSESHQALKSPEDQISPDEAKLDDVMIEPANGMVVANGSAQRPARENEQHHHHHHGHSHDLPASSGGTSDIATVAWMVIFGDGLHNFIDGLSIGAAFTESILSGISISVAVICEEFPHELGDFAILLNSGMKFKQALMYNFMSACMCYLGLAFGIILGDTTESAQWIFALAAGMFLYISLVNMVPELNQQAEEMRKSGTPLWIVLLLQHSGIITGFAIMYLMAAFGSAIDFTSAGNGA